MAPPYIRFNRNGFVLKIEDSKFESSLLNRASYLLWGKYLAAFPSLVNISPDRVRALSHFHTNFSLHVRRMNDFLTSEFSKKYKKTKELGKGAFGKAVLAIRRDGLLLKTINISSNN